MKGASSPTPKKPSIKQLRALLARLEQSHQEERKRLARRLHDDLSQKVTVLSFELSLLRMEMAEVKAARPWEPKIQKLEDLILHLSKSVRDLTNEVHPKVLDEFGLAAALECLAERSQGVISCKVQPPAGEIRLEPGVAAQIFDICEGILKHVFKPAATQPVEIKIEGTQRELKIQLSGPGVPAGKQKGPATDDLDWFGIEERACCLHGTVKKRNIARAGTIVALAFPRPAVKINRPPPPSLKSHGQLCCASSSLTTTP